MLSLKSNYVNLKKKYIENKNMIIIKGGEDTAFFAGFFNWILGTNNLNDNSLCLLISLGDVFPTCHLIFKCYQPCLYSCRNKFFTNLFNL